MRIAKTQNILEKAKPDKNIKILDITSKKRGWLKLRRKNRVLEKKEEKLERVGLEEDL